MSADQEGMPTSLSDALRTVAVNSAYDASRCLSKWLRQGVRLHTEGFERVPLHGLGHDAGAERPVVALHMALRGDLEGHTLLVIPMTTARELVRILLGAEAPETDDLDEMARSCLAETANIVSNAFANSWARWLGVTLELTPPRLHEDLLGVILEGMLIEQAMVSDEACLARTQFVMAGKSIDWDYYFLPTPASLRRIEQAVG
ncbi:MAG: chemotaxis protein CheX [Phycisphaerae bacterium]|nr:chemotaxis protein CheX [Phycisphaerae bacterium]